MAPINTSLTTLGRRLAWAALLSGLLAAELVADAATEARTLAAIAQRSFGAAQAAGIARRSTGPVARPATRRGTLTAVPVGPGAVAGPTRAAVRRPILDEVRVERTRRYRPLIEHHAQLNHVDPDLVQAIVYTESGGDRLAESPAGARGLMQLMPDTARQLGVRDPGDPAQSLAGGIRHLRDLLDRYGSTELALWAYNAGAGAVARGVLPSETEAYVPRVLAVRGALRALQAAADRAEGAR